MLVVKVGGSEGIDYDAFLEDFAQYENCLLYTSDAADE